MPLSSSTPTWLQPRPSGLYCIPGDFYIDPTRPVDKALITHGHADHARAGNRAVLATAETLAIMEVRYGPQANAQSLVYGETLDINGVSVRLAPAGHVLGSAQAVLEYEGCRIVISGDYKRQADPTCPAFEPVPCDVFVTEATFGLPVFRHPPVEEEIQKLLTSVTVYPDRCHLVGAYALGKAQRLICALRASGWDRPIYLHGALQKLCDLYQSFGIALGLLIPVAGMTKADCAAQLPGEIILAPPSALADRWSRRLPEPVTVMASGWMRVRARARQRGAELPLILSDHADWPGLISTLTEVNAPRVWVTHGREDALVHQARILGYEAMPLSLAGYEDEGGD